jgi:hypothetical protein
VLRAVAIHITTCLGWGSWGTDRHQRREDLINTRLCALAVRDSCWNHEQVRSTRASTAAPPTCRDRLPFPCSVSCDSSHSPPLTPGKQSQSTKASQQPIHARPVVAAKGLGIRHNGAAELVGQAAAACGAASTAATQATRDGLLAPTPIPQACGEMHIQLGTSRLHRWQGMPSLCWTCEDGARMSASKERGRWCGQGGVTGPIWGVTCAPCPRV